MTTLSELLKHKQRNETAKKTRTGTSIVTRHCDVNRTDSGGVIEVKIKIVPNAKGIQTLSFGKVTRKSKGTCGLFVAGGAQIDKMVASANERVTVLPMENF